MKNSGARVLTYILIMAIVGSIGAALVFWMIQVSSAPSPVTKVEFFGNTVGNGGSIPLNMVYFVFEKKGDTWVSTADSLANVAKDGEVMTLYGMERVYRADGTNQPYQYNKHYWGVLTRDDIKVTLRSPSMYVVCQNTNVMDTCAYTPLENSGLYADPTETPAP